ncbi:MAG: phosphatidate cytidylyltransferase [Euryarchaeota archaeon]|nr:phosphatidate cytidylyltransferase [Euryarchaeota archaeon]
MSLWIDIGIGVAELIYTFIIVFVMDAAVRRGFPQDVSRKIVHMWAGGLVVFWFFYTTPYGKYIFMATPALWVLLLVLTALTKDENDPTVKSMTRTGNPKELLLGVLFFPLMLVIMTFLAYRTLPGAVAIASVGFGDGIAPIFGKYWGKHKYRVVGRVKSIEGSIGVFLGTFIVSELIALVFFGAPYLYPILLASALAVVLEAISPSDVDNFIVPFGVWLLMLYLL